MTSYLFFRSGVLADESARAPPGWAEEGGAHGSAQPARGRQTAGEVGRRAGAPAAEGCWHGIVGTTTCTCRATQAPNVDDGDAAAAAADQPHQ